jgi:Heparinase II/III-like protein/Heparinase II/III N-terminus
VSDRTALHALRPVVCVIDTLYRDVQRADEARRGRFTNAGVTLDLGRHPDWIDGGLADDKEWRIEWVKLYIGLDLAHAYAITGDHDHLTTWEDLVEAFIVQVPVGHDTSDVTARRVQNWVYAWQRFAAAPHYTGLRGDLAERIVARLAADSDHLAEHLTPERNHRTMELYALLIVGIALGDGVRAAHALELLAENAEVDICDDGVQRERSSDYHMIVLRSFVGAIAQARAVDRPIPPGLVHRAHLACTFGLHLQRPDGTTPSLSDGDQADFRALLADASTLLDRADLAWAATLGVEGTPPTERFASFPIGGYVTQRSGWGDRGRAYGDELWSIMDCGPLGAGGHGHYDHLSVEMAAGADRLVVDPGRYTYADGPWRRWFKGTAAHNTVTVDGLDQQRYKRGHPKAPFSEAALLWRHTGTETPGAVPVDIAVARCTSAQYDAVHTRLLAMIDDAYWVVVDDLDAPTEHDYVVRWHFDVPAQGATTLERLGTLDVAIVPGGVIAAPAHLGTASLAGGWVSPTYGVKHAAPVLEIAADATATARFVAVIAPGTVVPLDVRAERDGGCGAVTIDWPGHTDRLAWTDGVASLERAPC